MGMVGYGLVRLRVVFDGSRGDDFIVYQVYDPNTNQWVEVGEEVFSDISDGAVDKPVAGGFMRNGIHIIAAVPINRVGKYRRYVVEWGDKLPKRPIMINEGVKSFTGAVMAIPSTTRSGCFEPKAPGHCPGALAFLGFRLLIIGSWVLARRRRSVS